jgi:hypothetical protein
MSNGGAYDLMEILTEYANGGVDPNDELYGYLCTTDMERFRKWRTRLDRVRAITVKSNSKKGKKAELIGRIYERLIRVLLDGCSKVFAHDGNVHSTTSEIDFLIRIQPTAVVIPMLREAGNHALGEAKCISTSLKTEWISEFVGRLIEHNARLGLLFIASPPKKLQVSQRTAIAIHSATQRWVVPFGITQMNKINDGENFLRLLSDQYTRALSHLTDIHI